MFFTTAIATSVLAFASTAVAGPVKRAAAPVTERNFGHVFNSHHNSVLSFNAHNAVFNSFGGLDQLNNFDGFFGEGNFCGQENVQVIQHQNVVQCRVTPVEIIQQQLAVVTEHIKRVVLTQSCDVEAQTLVFGQWLGGLVNFGQDLRRVNEGFGVNGLKRSGSRSVVFDDRVASHINNLVDVHGNIVTTDFGFTGSSIGQHAIEVLGSNWDNNVSPFNVGLVWESCVLAAGNEIPLGVSCGSQVCTAPSVVLNSIHPLVVHESAPVVVSSSISHQSFPGVIVNSGSF